MDYRQTPPAPRRNPFTIASMILGICSLCALGILFAILSYRKGQRMDAMAVTGLATSCLGLLFSVVMYGAVFSAMPNMLRDPEYRDMLNRYSESMYGESYDDLFERVYGVDLNDLFPTE